jgi:hypothetical protein
MDFKFLKTISSEMVMESILEPQYGIDGGFIPSGTINVEFEMKTLASKSAYGSTTKVPSARFNAETDVLEIFATDATIW